MSKLTKTIKGFNSLSEEEKKDFIDFFEKEVEEEAKEEEVEKKEEPKAEVKKEEVKEVKEEPKGFVTEEKLNDILAQILGKVALKEEVEELKVDKKKAKAFGTDAKPIVNETDDRDARLSKIMSDINSIG